MTGLGALVITAVPSMAQAKDVQVSINITNPVKVKPLGRPFLMPQLDGQGVPSAQVLDRLAVLPLDGVLEEVSKSAAGGDVRDVGHAATCADRDDESFVMEGECLQRPFLQLRVEIAGDGFGLLQRDLGQRRQQTARPWIDYRGHITGHVDLRVIQCPQILVHLDPAVVADGQPGPPLQCPAPLVRRPTQGPRPAPARQW